MSGDLGEQGPRLQRSAKNRKGDRKLRAQRAAAAITKKQYIPCQKKQDTAPAGGGRNCYPTKKEATQENQNIRRSKLRFIVQIRYGFVSEDKKREVSLARETGARPLENQRIRYDKRLGTGLYNQGGQRLRPTPEGPHRALPSA